MQSTRLFYTVTLQESDYFVETGTSLIDRNTLQEMQQLPKAEKFKFIICESKKNLILGFLSFIPFSLNSSISFLQEVQSISKKTSKKSLLNIFAEL